MILFLMNHLLQIILLYIWVNKDKPRQSVFDIHIHGEPGIYKLNVIKVQEKSDKEA